MKQTQKRIVISYIFLLITALGNVCLCAEETAEIATETIAEQQENQTELPKDQLASTDQEERFLINEVSIITDGPERRFYITTLDLEQRGFDGRIPSPDDIIDEELMYQDALKHKIPITEFAQKHIQSIKKQYKLTDEAFDKICADAGLDPQTALEKFEKMGACNTMVEHKSRIFIAEHEVKDFYEANPITKPAKYQLQISFVPLNTHVSLEQQIKDLELLLKTNAGAIHWNEPFWLKADDIAEDKMYLTRMLSGDISTPQLVDGGFEVIRLKDKKTERVVPLEKRYREIVHILRMPKLEEVVVLYKNELRTNASIVYIKQ